MVMLVVKVVQIVDLHQTTTSYHGGGGGGAGAAGESAGPGSGPGHAGRGGDGQPFPQFAYPLVFPGPDASSLGPYSPTTSHYGGGGGGGLHKAGGGATGVPSGSGGKGGYGGGGNGQNGPENFAGNPDATMLGINMLGGGGWCCWWHLHPLPLCQVEMVSLLSDINN